MDDKTKAKLFVCGFILFFVVAAFAISNSREKITGNVIREDCKKECNSNTDCNDYDGNTLDGCVYPGTCASKCVHELKK